MTCAGIRGLRMRHAPFAIGPAERDAWLVHMRVAVDELELDDDHDATLWGYLSNAADSLVNTVDDEYKPLPTVSRD